MEALAACLTVEQMADYFGVSHVTFIKMRETDPAINLAYKRGRAQTIADVAGNLLMKARAGDTASICFYLKTQAGWRETTRTELTGAEGGPIKHAGVIDLSDVSDEALKLAEELGLALSRNGKGEDGG